MRLLEGKTLVVSVIIVAILTPSFCARRSPPAHQKLPSVEHHHYHAKCTQKRQMFLPHILEQLAPWTEGIKPQHIEGGAELIREGINWLDSFEKPKGEYIGYNAKNFELLSPDHKDFPWSAVNLIKIVCINNTFYLTNGNVPMTPNANVLLGGASPTLYDLMSLTERYKLPDVVMLYTSGDFPTVFGPGKNGYIPPVFHCSGQRDSYNLQLPDSYPWQYHPDHPFDTEWPHYVETHTIPWEERKNTAVGRFNTMCPRAEPKNRTLDKLECPRTAIHRLMNDTRNKDLLNAGLFSGSADGYNLPYMGYEDALKYKYYLNLDGATVAFRLPYLLAGGWAVIHVVTSPLYSWFTNLMKPWVHFVPFGYDNYEEIFGVIEYLNDHPKLAEQIAQQGKKFAHDVLTQEGRDCYVLTLLQEYSDRLDFDVGTLADYPNAIPLKEGLNHTEYELDKWVTWARENNVI